MKIFHKINVAHIVTAFIFIVITAVMYYFFLAQCKEVLELENSSSDMLAYILTIQGQESGYSYPYPIMFWIAKLFYIFFPAEVALSLTVAFLNSFAFLAVVYFARTYIKLKSDKWYYSLLILCIFMYSMLFIPNYNFAGLYHRYLGVFSPNPFHNATYLAARPFVIISFFLFVQVYTTYKEKFDWKKGALFSLSLLLATMTKPSFTIVFVGAIGLVLLFELCKSKFKLWKQSICIGSLFIPTFLDLLYQYSGVFTGTDSTGEEAGIGIGYLTAWGEIASNIGVAILLVNAFSFVVLCFHYKELWTNIMYRLAWFIYGMGLIMFVFLYEKGFRIYHMNFAWGYMIGIFILVLVSAFILFRDTFENKVDRVKILFQWGAFALHVLCGIFYFITIVRGQSYL